MTKCTGVVFAKGVLEAADGDELTLHGCASNCLDLVGAVKGQLGTGARGVSGVGTESAGGTSLCYLVECR